MLDKSIYKYTNLMLLDFRTFNGEAVTSLNEEIKNFITKFQPLGIILFADNFVSIKQGKQLIDEFRACKSDLLITIDQEGGIVTRIKGATNFNGNMCLGATNDSNLAYQTGLQIGKELNAMGVSLNFAPVVDINSNPLNPVINIRSFGDSKELVTDFGNAMSSGLNDGGVLSCFKHFPGHGDVANDSHFELPVLNKTIDELKLEELYPFVHANSNIFMSAHIALPLIDDTKIKDTDYYLPFTMSKRAITLLKETLNQEIILISDAMNMRAISDHFTESEGFIQCIEAGIDIVCMPFIIHSTAQMQAFETTMNNLECTDEARLIEANLKVENLKKSCYSKMHSLDVIGNHDLEVLVASKGTTRDKYDVQITKKLIYTNSEFVNEIQEVVGEKYSLTDDLAMINEVDLIIFDSLNKAVDLIEIINSAEPKVIIHIRDPYGTKYFDLKHDNVLTFGFVRRNNGPDSESGGNVQKLVNFNIAFNKVINNDTFEGKFKFEDKV